MIPQYSAENAALSDGPASANTEAWHGHEHVADSAKVQAQAFKELATKRGGGGKNQGWLGAQVTPLGGF